MSLIELFLISIGVSMDAFAVAICKGLSLPKMSWKHALVVGLYFGGFQSIMPFLGFLLGSQFKDAIVSFDHWVAFILLSCIGLNMIKESLTHELDDCGDPSLHPGQMLLLALATSIDALALGVTFAFLQVKILPAVSFIGFTAFLFSILGVKVGNMFGAKYKSKAEFAGGLILIFMGGEILIDQLFGI
ncbi:manganese efflux pump MntP [Lacrimispora aerotolerans]|jgi:putative Mn2+ efflux pump MntP|uniref:manganese efflux pump MntP n=1 Tax=Lacrimispora aerotolerans TaxID=36832 RepID=UPI0004796427|nr:manganese efflux pump MntP family protein [Lacrimispora aerotolerans]